MTVRAELRWIVSGELPDTVVEWLAPRRASEHRVDLYLVERMRADLGAKRRAGDPRRVEVKEQVGQSLPVAVGVGCSGLVQRWSKRTDSDREAITSTPIIAVAKHRWRRGGLEAVQLEAHGRRSWSLALEWRGPLGGQFDLPALLADADRRLARCPVSAQLNVGLSVSYPQWLLSSGIRDMQRAALAGATLA